jgi:hypothetical protein
LKTTLEIPDILLRRAQSVAAERGIPLCQFVTEAIREKLETTEKPWMRHLGKLKHLHSERRKIDKRLGGTFEETDRDVWGMILDADILSAATIEGGAR